MTSQMYRLKCLCSLQDDINYEMTGVRVNALCPGLVNTSLLEQIKTAKATGPEDLGTEFRNIKAMEYVYYIVF